MDINKKTNINYIGYVRVSTREQNEDRQVIALREYGVPAKNIYTDRQSGKDFERRNYRLMLKRLKKGRVLVVKSIDRLGRNYEEIIEQWRHITKEIGADIAVLDMPLLDTTNNKDFLGTFIADLVLQILSFVSQNERENIHQRQAEGIAAAKARGVHFGRETVFHANNYIEIFEAYRDRRISLTEAVGRIGCSRCTFYHMLHELRMNGKVR